MRILNLFLSGGIGGIQILEKDICEKAQYENACCFLKSEGLIFDELVKMGISVYSIQKYHNLLRKITVLMKIASAYEIIVIHHCAITTHFYYCLLHLFFPHKKYVLVAHSCFEKKYNFDYSNPIKREMEKLLLKRSLKISDKVIFVSKAGKKSYMEAFDIAEEKTIVIYNGVDNLLYKSVYERRKAKNINGYRITYIGRLAEYKGVQLLLRALRLLVDQGIDIQCVIVGDGGYRTALERVAIDCRVENIVSFEGERLNKEDYLEKTDIFVYPSIWNEVFGLAIVEALSCGIPCVANRVGGIPEIISDGYNGYLAKESTAEALCSAILNVISLYENGDMEEVISNCRKSACKFDISETVQLLHKCYLDICNKGIA